MSGVEALSIDDIKAEVTDPLDLVTSIVYTRDADEKVSPDGFNPNNVTLTNVRVHNARSKNPLLFKNGFQIAEQVTSLSTKEFFEDDAKVKSTYYPEIAELVKAQTHAAVVIPFHHQLRSAAIPAVPRVSQIGKIRSPAGAAHIDYTAKYAAELFDKICPEHLQKGRFMIVNAWRNISDVNVIKNNHLAVCDARTITAPDDFVSHRMENEDGTTSNTYRLEPALHKRHRWYYYPDMTKNEVLLFTQFDSDIKSPARFTFHSAIKDPLATETTPLRESIEMRCLVLFPYQTACSLPELIYSSDDFVEAAVKLILLSLKYPDKWTVEAREWLRSVIHTGSEGVKTAMYGIVIEGAKRGSKSVKGASEAQQHRIIQRLHQTDFEALAKANFPLTPSV